MIRIDVSIGKQTQMSKYLHVSQCLNISFARFIPRRMKALATALLASVIIAAIAVAVVLGFAASISVSNVDKLGAGDANVEAPPNVQDVDFLLNTNDYTKVDKILSLIHI